MSGTNSPETPNPAVLRFRGLDLQAMAAVQMRSIETMRQMANSIFDSAEAITKQQAEFLEAGVGRMNTAFDHGEKGLDPRTIFERQTETYRDLFDMLATHVGGLSKITSKCCTGLVQEATGSMIDLASSESPTSRPESVGAASPDANSPKK